MHSLIIIYDTLQAARQISLHGVVVLVGKLHVGDMFMDIWKHTMRRTANTVFVLIVPLMPSIGELLGWNTFSWGCGMWLYYVRYSFLWFLVINNPLLEVILNLSLISSYKCDEYVVNDSDSNNIQQLRAYFQCLDPRYFTKITSIIKSPTLSIIYKSLMLFYYLHLVMLCLILRTAKVLVRNAKVITTAQTAIIRRGNLILKL